MFFCRCAELARVLFFCVGTWACVLFFLCRDVGMCFFFVSGRSCAFWNPKKICRAIQPEEKEESRARNKKKKKKQKNRQHESHG